MISPRMQRREIKKAMRAMEYRRLGTMDEPLTEPVNAKFGQPYCTKRSVVHIKESPPFSYIVDIRSRNGATVAKGVKVGTLSKTKVSNDIDRTELSLWVSCRLTAFGLAKIINLSESLQVDGQNDVERAGKLLRSGDEEDKYMALDGLFRALKAGLDVEGQMQAIINVLDERGDIIRIKSAELLHAMAVGSIDISKAEEPLQERLKDDNRVVVYYAALGLGKICWSRGDLAGLGKVMPFMTDNDRLQILRTIENIPAQQ